MLYLQLLHNLKGCFGYNEETQQRVSLNDISCVHLTWVILPHSYCYNPEIQTVFILLYLQYYNKFCCSMELNYFLNNAADWIITQQQNQKSTDVTDIFKLITNTSQQKQAHGAWIHFPVPTIWSMPLIINLAHAELYFQIHRRKKNNQHVLQFSHCSHPVVDTLH